MNNNKEAKYVRWTIFAWAIGIILIVIGWTFMRTTASDKIAQEAKNGIQELKATILVIQNDVQWIRQILEKQNKLQTTK